MVDCKLKLGAVVNMDNNKKLTSATFISLVAVFAAFNIVCDSLVVPPLLPCSGVWYSWVFISEPITGIILGPLAGFFSNLVGVMAAISSIS